jgi:hypothetical protein
VTILLQAETPAAEAAEPVRVYPSPRQEVNRVDALDCEAGAMHDIGGHRVCETHYLEVLRAYWNANANLILHHYDEPRGHCGDRAEVSWS